MKGKRQMTKSGKFGAYGLAALLSAFSLVAKGQPGNQAVIQERLNAQFKLTRTTADRTDIVSAGDVVELRKPGLVMFSQTQVPSTNNYLADSHSRKGGVIGQGLGTVLIMANPNTLQRQFVPGEKFWVTGIQVQKDGIVFALYSDPYNSLRYYGDLKIIFPNKKEVPSVDAAVQMVAEVLTNASADDQSSQGGQAGPVPAGTPASPPASAPLQAIAPPPPPPDAPPQTIELGQTKDQVVAAFGQPVKLAKLGPKEIFYYKDMKVTFVEGKVSNVE